MSRRHLKILRIWFFLPFVGCQFAVRSGATGSAGIVSAPLATATSPCPGSSHPAPSWWSAGTVYGNLGDPYASEPGIASATPVMLSDCGVSLASNTVYRLARDVGSDPTATCFLMNSTGTVLDLAGHTVTGRIRSQWAAQGNSIFNGNVHCQWNDDETTGEVGCISIVGAGEFQGTTRLHHLTVSNSGSLNTRAIHIDWGSTTVTPTATAIHVYNVTASVPPQPTALRSSAINIQGGSPTSETVEVDHNDLTCTGQAGACQGISCWGVSECKAHHNRITMEQNVSSETGRAISFDLEGSSLPAGTMQAEAWNNLVVANNNRAVRLRGAFAQASFHDNLVCNVASGVNEISAVHVGDMDQGVVVQVSAVISGNTFEVSDGNVLMIRNATAALFENNVIACAGSCTGKLGEVRAENNGPTQIDFLNNPTATLLPAPQVSTEAGASVRMCHSGTAAGAGGILDDSGC